MTIMHGISSAGICSGKGDHMFTCDSTNLQHVYINDISNCYSEARVSDNENNNNPGTVSWKVKKTRVKQSELPNINPRNDLLYPLENIRILFWNIHGLSQDKLSDNLLGAMFKGYDIILLSETWASDHDEFMLEGFEYHNYPRKYTHPNSIRNSGGLGVSIRQTIREGIDIWCHTEDIVAWYISRKSFFGLKSDIYLGNIYIVPENSAYLRNEEFHLLYQYKEKIP